MKRFSAKFCFFLRLPAGGPKAGETLYPFCENKDVDEKKYNHIITPVLAERGGATAKPAYGKNGNDDMERFFFP